MRLGWKKTDAWPLIAGQDDRKDGMGVYAAAGQPAQTTEDREVRFLGYVDQHAGPSGLDALNGLSCVLSNIGWQENGLIS